MGFLLGNVVWSYVVRGVTIRLLADRMVWVVDLPEKDAAPAAGAGREERPRAAQGREGSAAGGISSRLGDLQSFTIVAENCRIEIPARKTYLEAETLYYEHRTERGIARNARLLSTSRPPPASSRCSIHPASPGLRSRRHVRSENLFLRSPELPRGCPAVHRPRSLRRRGLEVSVCDFACPNFALSASTVRLESAGDGTAGGRRSGARARDAKGDHDSQGDMTARGTSAHSSSTPGFVARSRGIVSCRPLGKWDTRWQTSLPIRKLDVGKSSKFGAFGEVDWNLNYFLSLLPPSRFLPLEVVGKTWLGFETDFLEKRGTGIGPHAEYGTRPRKWDPWQLQLGEWNYYGEAQYFRIHDKADEDRSTRLPVRGRTALGNVCHGPVGSPRVGLRPGVLEAVGPGSRRVLAHEAKRRAPVGPHYFRRNLLDNLAVTASIIRARRRRARRALPEGKAPIPALSSRRASTRLGCSRPIVGGRCRAYRPACSALRCLNEWAYPVSWLAPWVQLALRLLRFTQYRGKLLDDTRGRPSLFGAGGGPEPQLSKVYRFERPLAHRIWGFEPEP